MSSLEDCVFGYDFYSEEKRKRVEEKDGGLFSGGVVKPIEIKC